MGLSRVKANAQNGQYSFICLNYINDFERLETIFN